ncbi:MAG: chemotaxis protein CheC [Miltoncostaeaceae bacterium]
MTEALHYGQMQLDALREVGNIGAGTAASALAQMTGKAVNMGVPRVSVLQAHEIPDRVGGGEAIVAAAFMRVEGDAPGHMLFLMPEDAAHEIVEAMVGGVLEEEPVVASFGEMKLSALQEVGNILTGSYLRAIAELTGLHLEPSPPAVGVDMADALLTQALAEAAGGSEVALLIETAFADGDLPPSGQFVFVPGPDSIAAVLEGLGVSL